MSEKDTKTRKTYRRVTPAERYAMSLLLQRHCSSVGNESVYAEGWDDEKIAAETGLQPNHVAYFRREVMGPLKRKEPVGEPSVEYETLKVRVDALEKCVAFQDEKIAALINALGGLT